MYGKEKLHLTPISYELQIFLDEYTLKCKTKTNKYLEKK